MPTIRDAWHASATTTAADLAAFTAADLDVARSRLTRLAQVFDVRLWALTDDQLDRRDGSAWSPRQIAFHLTESLYYARSVGGLSAGKGPGTGKRGPEGPLSCSTQRPEVTSSRSSRAVTGGMPGDTGASAGFSTG